MFLDIVLGILRTLLATWGGVLVSGGYLTADQEEKGIGAVLAARP